MGIKITIQDTHTGKVYGEFTSAGLNTDDFYNGLLMQCKFRYDPEEKDMPHFEMSTANHQVRY